MKFTYSTLKKSAVTLSIFSASMSSMASEESDQLRHRIELLEKQVQVSQKSTSNTQFNYGGYIKFDAIASRYSDGEKATAAVGEDFFIPSTIPIGGDSGDYRIHMTAKTSRFYFTTKTTTEAGSISTRVELDFMLSGQGDERISNSNSPRARHAFVNWRWDERNELLAGQTWSTFFNVGALSETLDFVGPVGTLFNRQPMLRYTHKTETGSIQLAAENPASTLYGGNTSTYDDNRFPDVVARYNGNSGQLRYSVASLLREISYQDAVNNVAHDEREIAYGLSISGKYTFNNRDDLRVMINAGNGLGRYMSLNGFRTGNIESDGKLKLIHQQGGFIAYRHFWNEKWRTNIVVSASKADNPKSVSGTTAEKYQSTHLNLLYSPVKALSVGGEILTAKKTLENNDEGSLNRFQFSVKYGF